MATVREYIIANAYWGVANEQQIHYSQGSSRFDALWHPQSLPLYTDCSGFVTLCYAWAGASDPNGLGYNGTGYTGTLLHLPEIPLSVALPGDLIVYGPGTGDHVVVIVETGADPWTVSHGQEAGPIKVRHSVEARAHTPPFRVLRGLVDAPAPPPPAPIPPAPKDTDMEYYLIQGDKNDAWVWTNLVDARHVKSADQAGRFIYRALADGHKVHAGPNATPLEPKWLQEDVDFLLDQ